MLNKIIQIDPFKPAITIKGPHAQTISGVIFRPRHPVSMNRERLETPDNDFIDIDYINTGNITWKMSAPEMPIVILLPGIEGSSEGKYILEISKQLSEYNIRSLVINYRGCSGENNNTNKFYHAGFTEDIEFIHQIIHQRYLKAKIGIIAFSLGANIMLKYLGEMGKKIIDYDMAIKSKTQFEFDTYCTDPLYGYKNVKDYYMQNSSRFFLHNIFIPTLIIRSLDDPFFSPEDVPFEIIGNNNYIKPIFTKHGKHVGFIEGNHPGDFSYWAERQSARFISTIFNQN